MGSLAPENTTGSKSPVEQTKTCSLATGKVGTKAYPLATQSDEDVLLYHLSIMGMQECFLHT
jgi:hypothetical protein